MLVNCLCVGKIVVCMFVVLVLRGFFRIRCIDISDIVVF